MSPLVIMQLIAMALPIVTQIEQLIVGIKQGALKKELAVGAITSALDLTAQSGGMKPATADAAKALAPAAVDAVVGVLNAVGVFKPSAPVAPQA